MLRVLPFIPSDQLKVLAPLKLNYKLFEDILYILFYIYNSIYIYSTFYININSEN